MIVRRIDADALERKPFELWNVCINLVATEAYANLDEIQRVAHLAFWYDSEVQNGGHLQFFENRGPAPISETMAALTVLGAECQRSVLQRAARALASRERPRIKTADQYVEAALEGEFTELDSAYYACEPSVPQHLQRYFEENRAHFVEITRG